MKNFPSFWKKVFYLKFGTKSQLSFHKKSQSFHIFRSVFLQFFSLFLSNQISGTPANIIKPFSSLDTTCPMQDINTNSVYKHAETTSNDVDGDENSIVDNNKSKVTRHSPTYSLELSSGSTQPITCLTVLLSITLLVVNLRYFSV